MISLEGMARALVSQLPSAPPGPGASVTVTAERGQTSLPPGQPTGPALTAKRILERPQRGTGDFLVAVASRPGRPAPTATLSWVDNDAGRYAIISDTGRDGRSHITYTPADQPKLDHLLTRLINNFR
jgi:hypothetical protein